MQMITPAIAPALKAVVTGHLLGIATMNRWAYSWANDARRVETVRTVAATSARDVLGCELADLSPDVLLELGTLIVAVAAEIDATQPTRCL